MAGELGLHVPAHAEAEHRAGTSTSGGMQPMEARHALPRRNPNHAAITLVIAVTFRQVLTTMETGMPSTSTGMPLTAVTGKCHGGS